MVRPFLALALTLGTVGLTPSPGRAEGAPTPLTGSLEGLAEGAQALAEGDAARAEIAARAALAALPAGAGAGRAELVLGRALQAGDRGVEAAEALARSLPRLRDEDLAAVARLERARALLAVGQADTAAGELAALAARPPGAVARQARWLLPDALLRAGRAADAVAASRALLTEDPAASAAPATRLVLAGALRATGDERGAIAAYRALWMEHPSDPAGRAAGAALRAWRRAGGAVPPATAEERLARAARLLELALPRRALRTLDRLDAASPEPEPATRSALLRALALLQLGRRAEAAALAAPLEASPAAAAGTRRGAELVLARAAARSGRVAEAAARYRRLAAGREPIPGLTPAQARALPEDAAFLAAWLWFDAGADGRAVRELRDYLRRHPRAARADDARWFEAWALRRLGRRDDARRALARLRGGLAPAATYWQARMARSPAQARDLYRRVLREAPPGTWYALLAAGRLAVTGERPPPLAAATAQAIPDGPGDGATARVAARAATLLGAGLRGEALVELRAAAAAPDAHGHAAVIAQLAEAAGDAELPFRMARDHLPPTRRALRWLYPRAFAGLVEPSAAATGIDPALDLAVMRRESAFRPEARSGAGAVGLVQLIPPTAERLATVYGLPRDDSPRLDLPEVSVPLGAAYLGLLTARFVDPAVVLAAYNAGPRPAAAWARDRAGRALDEWVEEIPYRETRRYVRNVSADRAVYRTLWEGEPLAIDGARRVPPPREGVGF